MAALRFRDVFNLLYLGFREALDVQQVLGSGVLDIGDRVQAEVLQLLDVGRRDSLVREQINLQRHTVAVSRTVAELVEAEAEAEAEAGAGAGR